MTPDGEKRELDRRGAVSSTNVSTQSSEEQEP